MRFWWFGLGFVVLVGGLIGLSLRPVCVPLSSADLAGFTVPLDERADKDLYLRVFQRRDGQWYQCKTWLSRQFFF